MLFAFQLTLVQLRANGILPLLDGRGPNLAAKEQFIPRYAAGLNGPANLRLVPVKLRTGTKVTLLITDQKTWQNIMVHRNHSATYHSINL